VLQLSSGEDMVPRVQTDADVDAENDVMLDNPDMLALPTGNRYADIKDGLEPGYQGSRRRCMYRTCAICSILGIIATACSIAAYNIAWSDWAQTPEWLSYERAKWLSHTQAEFGLGAQVTVAGRHGTVIWDGRPANQHIRVRWMDENSESADIPVSSVKAVSTLPQEIYKPVRDHVLYIGIISPPSNAEQRAIARRMWVDAAKDYRDGCVKVEFLIGQVSIQGDNLGGTTPPPTAQVIATEDEKHLETQLQSEATLHNDISRVPVVESVNFETDKVLWLLSNAVYWKARFVMKINDNQKVDLDVAMATFLQRSPIAQPIYFGKVQAWAHHQPGMYCANFQSKDRSVVSLDECEERCGDSCAGVSYSHLSLATENCLICSDDRLLKSESGNFDFYRKPVWQRESSTRFLDSQCYGISGDLAHKISANHMLNSNEYASDDTMHDSISMAKWVAREDEDRKHYQLLPVKHLRLPELCRILVDTDIA